MCTREPAHTELGRDITLRDDLTPAQLTAVTVLLSIALWNAFEMVPLVFFTFKRFRTLYFWSICAATLGVMMCTTSQFISTWGPAPFDRTRLIASCISCIGWAPMVTGQSLVLYSRLHLLNVSPRTLKIVRFLIILDGVTLHTIGTAFTLEPLITHSTRLEHVYKLFEKIQITAFMAQEFMLSGIYLWKAHELLGQFDSPFHLGRSRLSPCRIEPKDKVQLSYKTFAYALKLKIELGILNQLVGFVRRVHSMNTEANMNARMEGEWQTTLERTFATESHH
ncbi:uncharacterized protein PG998_006561 [Apiospora kogelbergensis]|uniref:uncharacterized protein n=1 Tax=Apiospora kogelbergensis TaxID=1337665 RepID=UPI0031318DFB